MMSAPHTRTDKEDPSTNAMSKAQDLTYLLGKLRASKEVTEIGCLLMLLGLAEVVQPATWIAGSSL